MEKKFDKFDLMEDFLRFWEGCPEKNRYPIRMCHLAEFYMQAIGKFDGKLSHEFFGCLKETIPEMFEGHQGEFVSHDKAPEILAEDYEGGLKIYCKHCGRNHFHGEGLGHRVAHCEKKTPYTKTGYTLVHINDLIERANKIIKEQKSIKERGK